MITAKQYVRMMHGINHCLSYDSQQKRLTRLSNWGDQQLHGHERTQFATIEIAHLVDIKPLDKSSVDDLVALHSFYHQLVSISEANDGNGDFRAEFKLSPMERASFNGMDKFVDQCTRSETNRISQVEWDAYEVLRSRDQEGVCMVEWCQSLLDGIAVHVAQDLTLNDQVFLANGGAM